MSTGAQTAFQRTTWQLLPLAPAIVIVFGMIAAALAGFVGIRQLRRESDEQAQARAQVLAATMASRLRAMPDGMRLEALQVAARRTGALFVVLDTNGQLVHDASLGAPPRDVLARMTDIGHGEAETAVGRTRYAAHWLGIGSRHAVVSFVRAPRTAGGESAMLAALAAFTTLLVGAAAVFAYFLARDTDVDVELLAARVHGMSKVETEPSGERAPVRTLDETGALTAAFNALVDRFVDAERMYRQNLERASAADRERAAFLAAVSHELRSPLNAILGFTDLLMQEVDGPLTETAREELEQVRASGAHLAELISDILELSALEGGQLRLSPKTIDIVPIAGEVLREASALAAGRPVRLALHGDANVFVEADPRRVRQIFTNLVGNAVKFTTEGEVSVTVVRHGAFAKISIRDTGPGISEVARKELFRDFRQAEDEKRRRRGSGLGLAITRRLVKMHGGTIALESEIGQGSTFEVSLPLRFAGKASESSSRSVA